MTHWGQTKPLNLHALQNHAQSVASCLGAGDVILLRGNLGAGKTTWSRAFLAAAGVRGEVPSPTFTLVQTYDLPLWRVYHFDLYRLKGPEEIEELGFDEACADGVVLVEWPEKAAAYMPHHALTVFFEIVNDDHRRLSFDGPDLWQERIGTASNANAS